jgi:hypothetical protein
MIHATIYTRMDFSALLEGLADLYLRTTASQEKVMEYPILTDAQLAHRRKKELPWDPDVLDATETLHRRKPRQSTIERP